MRMTGEERAEVVSRTARAVSRFQTQNAGTAYPRAWASRNKSDIGTSDM
jgi:hypothetical protein